MVGRVSARWCGMWATVLVLFVGAVPAAAQPKVLETGWTLIRQISFSGAQSARLGPTGDEIFVGRRGTSSDGLYSIDSIGLESKLAAGSNVAGVLVTPAGGIFFSEDHGGVIYKVDPKTSSRTAWAYGFHGGDDDPVGLAVAPSSYVGTLIKPGEALMVDRGSGGPDEIWQWSPAKLGSAAVLHADNGTLVDPVDVAITSGLIYVIDAGGSAAGAIYTMGQKGVLAKVSTSKALADPLGVAVESATGDLEMMPIRDRSFRRRRRR